MNIKLKIDSWCYLIFYWNVLFEFINVKIFIKGFGVGGVVNYYLVKEFYLRIVYKVKVEIKLEFFFELLVEKWI